MGYPNTRFRYKVEIDGLDAGGFSEVTGFDASIDVVEYRELSVYSSTICGGTVLLQERLLTRHSL